jgi:hypothetical protein
MALAVRVRTAHQPASDDVPCGESGTRKSKTLTIDSRVDRHTGLVHDRAACDVGIRNPCRFQPLGPIIPTVQVQKDVILQIE